jgi:aldose 1-epimerase
VDETLIPNGELRPVKGTPLDFTTTDAHRGAGRRLLRADEEGRRATTTTGSSRGHARASCGSRPRVTEPKSGRVLEVLTTSPASSSTRRTSWTDRIKGKAEGPT